jgi:molybdopterin-binding protein
MPDYPMGTAAALLGVSVDTLRRWADAGRVATTRSSGGRRTVEGRSLARFAQTIGMEPHHPDRRRESARNHFLGLVTKVTRDVVMAQVELQAGPHRVVALISREAADELGLDVGVLAVASVKATNVVIELPDRA